MGADPQRFPFPAILLCGGRGVRLRPLTDVLPKPLVPLAGRPILQHLMELLARRGVSRFVLAAGYRAEKVREAAPQIAPAGCTWSIVDSGEEADIARRIADGMREAGGDVLVCYGDTLADVDLTVLRGRFEAERPLGIVSTYQLTTAFGVVDADERGVVTGFREKPTLPIWYNIGFAIFAAEARPIFERATDMVEALTELATTGRLLRHEHRGEHITFNTLEQKEEAERAIHRIHE